MTVDVTYVRRVYISEKVGFITLAPFHVRRICTICRGSKVCQACYGYGYPGCICDTKGTCVICGGYGFIVTKK